MPALRPLRLAAFRRLALAGVVNELGNWLALIALPVLVFGATGSALASGALFLSMQFLPAFLAPLVIARVERLDVRFALTLLYGVEAAAFGVLAILSTHFALVTICVVASLDGVLVLAARALSRGAVAALLTDSGELRAGNALLNIGFTGATAAGPIVAGVLVATSGATLALLLDAASFLMVAVVFATASRFPAATGEPGESWLQRLRDGLSFVRRAPLLRRLLAAQGAAFVFFTITIPVDVVYTSRTLGSGAAGLGALLGTWGVGMLAGGLLFAGTRRLPLSVLMFASTLAMGASFLGLAAAPTLLLACVAAALGGVGNGVQWVSVLTAVQEATPQRLQARIVGLLESVAALAPAAGFVLGSVIATLLSPRASYLLAGLGVFAVVGVATPLLTRPSRRSPATRPQAAQ